MDRLQNNLKCLALLEKALKENPDLRIEQLFYTLDGIEDFFYEEPTKTLKRWEDIINKFNKNK